MYKYRYSNILNMEYLALLLYRDIIRPFKFLVLNTSRRLIFLLWAQKPDIVIRLHCYMVTLYTIPWIYKFILLLYSYQSIAKVHSSPDVSFWLLIAFFCYIINNSQSFNIIRRTGVGSVSWIGLISNLFKPFKVVERESTPQQKGFAWEFIELKVKNTRLKPLFTVSQEANIALFIFLGICRKEGRKSF